MRKHTEIPFGQDSSRLFLPWISLMMVFIAVLVLAGGMAGLNYVDGWTQNVSGSMTVQIPVVDDKGESRAEQLDNDIEATLTVLRTSPGILGAKVLEDEQIKRLMEPWVGNEADLNVLPLPKIIDVNVDTRNLPDVDALKNELASTVPVARLDSHRLWLENLVELANGFMKLTVFVLFLLILTTSFAVIYTARTSLSVHQNVISLVHMMGATDSYVAWQYGNRTFRLSLAGGVFGFLLALPVLFGAGYFFQTLGVDSGAVLTASHWLVLASVPVLFAILAFGVTIKTVLETLKRAL